MQLHTDAYVQALRSHYVAAELELRTIVQDAVLRGAKGTARYYAAQQEDVQRILSSLNTEGERLATEAVAQSYITGALVAERTLGIGGGFAGVHQDAVKVLVSNLVEPLNESVARIGRQVDDVFRKASLTSVTTGLLEGRTRKDTTRVLVRNLVNQGVTGFVDNAGRRWSLSNYATMVARTTTREAVSHGTANRMLENGHDLVTISSHTHTPDECSDYDGQTFSLSGEDDEFPALDMYPPFHPNCVHVLTPAAATMKRFEQSLAEDAAEVKPPVTADPYDLAAQNVRAVADEWKVPGGTQYSIDRLAPKGLADPALDEPWAKRLDGSDETKRDRINSIIAEARARDIDHLTRVGQAVDDELVSLVKAERKRAEEKLEAAHAEVKTVLDSIDAKTDALLKLNRVKVVDRDAAWAEKKATLTAERDALELEYGAFNDKQYKIQQVLQHVEASTLQKLLERVRPGYGKGELDSFSSEASIKLNKQVREKTRFLPKEWVDAGNRRGLEVRSSSSRAHYHDSGEGKPYLRVQMNSHSTQLHELGHHMENTYDPLRVAQQRFYEHRTKGEVKKKLRDLLGSGYDEWEEVREDKFTHAYMGKDYGGKYYELLTMGLEGVFYRSHGLLGKPQFIIDDLTEAVARKREYIKTLERAGDATQSFMYETRQELHVMEKNLETARGDREYANWIVGLLAVL